MKKLLIPLMLCLILSRISLFGQYCESATVNLTPIVGSSSVSGLPSGPGQTCKVSSNILGNSVAITNPSNFIPEKLLKFSFSNGQATLLLTWIEQTLVSYNPNVNTYVWQVSSSNNKSTSITIYQKPSVSLTLPFSAVCRNSESETLSGESPSGGVFSGSGVSGTAFSPSEAGEGSKIIQYVYTDPSTSCSNTVSDTVNVLGLPDVSIGEIGPFCANSNPVNLTGGKPEGGYYSGPGVTDNKFNPVGLSGDISINYNYTEICSNTATSIVKILDVNKPELPVLSKSFKTSMCKGSDQVLHLDNVGNNSVQWFNGDSLLSSEAICTIINITKEIPLTIRYKDTNTCISEDKNVTIEIDNIKADFSTQQTPVVVGEAFFIDKSINAVKWQWAIDTLATFDIQNPMYYFYSVGTENIKLVVTSENNCIDSVTKTITVTPAVMNISDLNRTNIKIFPNPIKEIVSIDLTGKDEDVIISIVSIAGVKVLEKSIKNANGIEMIDIAKLPAGNYLLFIEYKGYSETVKIQKD